MRNDRSCHSGGEDGCFPPGRSDKGACPPALAMDRCEDAGTREAFLGYVAQAYRDGGETRPLSTDAAAFTLTVEGGPKHHLQNLFRECATLPADQRARAVAEHVAASREISTYSLPADGAAAAAGLRASIVLRARVEAWALERELSSASTVTEPGAALEPPSSSLLCEHLAVTVAYDFPKGIFGVTDEQLDRWGLTHHAALDRARSNLRVAAGRDLTECFTRTASGLHVSAFGDEYDAARVILPGDLRRLRIRNLVAMPAHRGMLLLADGTNRRAMLEMTALTAEALNRHPWAIAGVPICLTKDDRWKPYTASGDAALAQAMRILRLRTRALEYAAQSKALNRYYARLGEDVFVASFMTSRETPLRRSDSYAVWGRGIVSLLPQADRVVFMDVGDDREKALLHGHAPWAHVRRVVRHLMTPLNIYPPRYRVAAFPSPAELKRIAPELEDQGCNQ